MKTDSLHLFSLHLHFLTLLSFTLTRIHICKRIHTHMLARLNLISTLVSPLPSSLSLSHDCPPEASSLETESRAYLDSFLQCSILFFQSLTGIKFMPPSGGRSLHNYIL